ncbi:MAG: DNA mismatch repair endonuclease MutL [Butyrivibrio sp.]|nr:DNA mismatch repair endonuclease MutL [Butyrivibrio sp.]
MQRQQIRELDENTVNQIAAGEVIERPASVVKELVENAIDAGATAITVEIRDGGIRLIRVTDNGCGIRADQIGLAFQAHATSKLTRITDLYDLHTLGFRGEALSSIAAVAEVELVTRTEDALSGTRVVYTGGVERVREEIGAPTGSTFLIRELFGNVPARRKFLKTPQTESSYVSELMEHLALDNPTVSLHFINNRQDRFTTSGNGDLKELIYRIYGRDVSMSIRPIHAEEKGMVLDGYLGEPALNRSNRNFEMFFVNGRYIRDKMLSRALEEGYQQYLMQHKFPFAILHLQVAPGSLDVNVHPSKLEIRFDNAPVVSDFVRRQVEATLHANEMIPRAILSEEKEKTTAVAQKPVPEKHEAVPEPFEFKRLTKEGHLVEDAPVFAEGLTPKPVRIEDNNNSALWKRLLGELPQEEETEAAVPPKSAIIKNGEAIIVEKPMQMDLFGEKLLSEDNRQKYRVLGQVFGTYWLITFEDQLLIVDQHAAHEKVNYEHMIARYRSGSLTSQLVNPPVIVTLSAAEEETFLRYRSSFEKLGFNIENFGGREYAMRAVPAELFGCSSEKAMFLEVLDELSEESHQEDIPDVIGMKIASMACKASVKGNSRMSAAEMEALIDELLQLDNPYNCPHGRPTIIKMSKYELDKKFRRVVT